MKKTACPGCGAGYDGRHCRSCGYTYFREEIPWDTSLMTGRKDPSRRERKTPARHPLIRFLLLLCLIGLLLPLFREWGLKLEAMEEASRNNSSYQSGEVPHG